jgi:hypothetical protein
VLVAVLIEAQLAENQSVQVTATAATMIIEALSSNQVMVQLVDSTLNVVSRELNNGIEGRIEISIRLALANTVISITPLFVSPPVGSSCTR